MMDLAISQQEDMENDGEYSQELTYNEFSIILVWTVKGNDLSARVSGTISIPETPVNNRDDIGTLLETLFQTIQQKLRGP